jgi:CHAD domain-containing protein
VDPNTGEALESQYGRDVRSGAPPGPWRPLLLGGRAIVASARALTAPQRRGRAADLDVFLGRLAKQYRAGPDAAARRGRLFVMLTIIPLAHYGRFAVALETAANTAQPDDAAEIRADAAVVSAIHMATNRPETVRITVLQHDRPPQAKFQWLTWLHEQRQQHPDRMPHRVADIISNAVVSCGTFPRLT